MSTVNVLCRPWNLRVGPGNFTLGARDFSRAVSGFCQVFIVTRASLRRSWLRPTAEDVSAVGQHRRFPPHARKTSGTQGMETYKITKNCSVADYNYCLETNHSIV